MIERAAGEVVDAGAPAAAALATALLAWFRDRVRDVPWREERDPYRIWVAEVMAQQTRVGTVRSYYARFLERFPDVRTLAAAELDEVLRVWEGLGYYGRARNLHRAARTLVEQRDGQLPKEIEELLELPGVGPYTAGAIASLAFGHPEPAVDANTRRVLARLFDLESPTPARLQAAAREILASRPGEAPWLNQAMMDLGSAICRSRKPACPRCPLETECLARARGTVGKRPAAPYAHVVPHHDIAVGIVWKRGEVLIQRRPENRLLGGLWEFPGGKVEARESPRDAVAREIREELGISVRVTRPLEPIKHAYSHLRVTLHPFHTRWVAGEPAPREATAWCWTPPTALEAYAFPAANRRIIRALAAGGPDRL